MKIIVISGGGRRVGKTTLARSLKEILTDCAVVKLGTHPPRGDKPEQFFPHGTDFSTVIETIGSPKYLVLESGSILDDPTLQPDLVIFLPASQGQPDKPGSERRRARADLIRGKIISMSELRSLAARVDLDEPSFRKVLSAIGVPVAEFISPL